MEMAIHGPLKETGALRDLLICFGQQGMGIADQVSSQTTTRLLMARLTEACIAACLLDLTP